MIISESFCCHASFLTNAPLAARVMRLSRRTVATSLVRSRLCGTGNSASELFVGWHTQLHLFSPARPQRNEPFLTSNQNFAVTERVVMTSLKFAVATVSYIDISVFNI
jgi:hypothetical protein